MLDTTANQSTAANIVASLYFLPPRSSTALRDASARNTTRSVLAGRASLVRPNATERKEEETKGKWSSSGVGGERDSYAVDEARVVLSGESSVPSAGDELAAQPPGARRDAACGGARRGASPADTG